MIQTWGCASATLAPSARAPANSSKPNRPRITVFMSSRLGRCQQAAAAQQGVRLRLPATKRDIGFFRIARAAGRIDVVVQALCGHGIENVASVLESAESVGIHHLGPHIAVVTRGVMIAGEDMAELLGPVPEGNLG